MFTGCGVDDLSTPTIVLDGDDPMIVDLGGSYTDPGFTATDDEDGDISANVVVDDTDVNTDEIGEYEGAHYIVTEYVEGETLRQRISRAPHQQIDLHTLLPRMDQCINQGLVGQGVHFGHDTTHPA